MHELSIAMSIIEVAQEEAAARGLTVSGVHLRLGPLSGVVADALSGAWELACTGTPLEGARLEIDQVPVVVMCPACRDRKTLASMQEFCCPDCGTPTPEVLQGAELQVTALEVEE